MPLSDEQKTSILDLKGSGMSNRGIAETLHISKDSVNRFLSGKGVKNGAKKCAEKIPAHARATKEVAQNDAEKSAPLCANSAPEDEKPDRDAMATMAYVDARRMRDVALKGLERAAKETNAKDRAWMESVYLKSLKESTRMLGMWGGLDALTDGNNHALEVYAEAMKVITSSEPTEEWEVKG